MLLQIARLKNGMLKKMFHAFVKCLDCDWEQFSYKNAQAISKIHAEKYGHKVQVWELGISFYYDGRKK